MVAAGRTDQLYGRNSGNSRANFGEANENRDELLSGDENGAAMVDGKSRTSMGNPGTSPMGHSLAQKYTSSQVKPASKKRAAHHGRKMYPEDDQCNQFLSLVIQ